MNEIDLQRALDVAMAAAKTAAAYVMERHKEIDPMTGGLNLGIETKASARDFVTEVDKESQRILIEEIRRHFPDHRFIAEEDGADDLGDPSSPYAWILDPVDGTTCFIHGRDNFGIIIALQKEGITKLGVIYLPVKDELFYGIKGQGGFFNGKPIVLRRTRDMSDAILASNTVRRGKQINGVLHVTTPYCGSLENYGSAAQEFSEMLKGHNDGCFFEGIRLWDVAAGCFLVEEAGGRSEYSFIEPGNIRGGLIVVSATEPIFDELKKFVQEQM